ncbi:hypothetical protein [Lysinibacillus xylanilyticus]|uniref:Methyltransferase n=1 Tax=Lysinibacillus xylanilyticus TaxID=582475 RepID=A0ABV3VYQ1_9BACI
MDELWGITDHYDFKDIFSDPHRNLPGKEDEDQDTMEFSRFWYHGMYTIIDSEWVIPLAEWLKKILTSNVESCVEIMSGRGWLAKALELQEVDIIATDDGSDYLHRRNELQYPPLITEAVYSVERMAANEVANFISKVNQEESKRFLILICYPPDNLVAFEFVRKLPKGTLIIYIGDEKFELTACRNFADAITWLDEPQHSNHPEAFLLNDFPHFKTIEGIGNDGREENTVVAAIKLGII